MNQKRGSQQGQKCGGRGPCLPFGLLPTGPGTAGVSQASQIWQALHTYPRLLKTVSAPPVFHVLILLCLLELLSQALYPVVIVGGRSVAKRGRMEMINILGNCHFWLGLLLQCRTRDLKIIYKHLVQRSLGFLRLLMLFVLQRNFRCCTDRTNKGISKKLLAPFQYMSLLENEEE